MWGKMKFLTTTPDSFISASLPEMPHGSALEVERWIQVLCNKCIYNILCFSLKDDDIDVPPADMTGERKQRTRI